MSPLFSSPSYILPQTSLFVLLGGLCHGSRHTPGHSERHAELTGQAGVASSVTSPVTSPVTRCVTAGVTSDKPGVNGPAIARVGVWCQLLMHRMCVSAWCDCACHRKSAA